MICIYKTKIEEFFVSDGGGDEMKKKSFLSACPSPLAERGGVACDDGERKTG